MSQMYPFAQCQCFALHVYLSRTHGIVEAVQFDICKAILGLYQQIYRHCHSLKAHSLVDMFSLPNSLSSRRTYQDHLH